MTKLETVDRIKQAIEAGPATAVRDNPSKLEGRPWEVISFRQEGQEWPVKVHSAHAYRSDAEVAWVHLERQKIARIVVETLREPTFDMVHAGVERLRSFASVMVPGPVLEEAWAAMVEVLLAELPVV